jgi:hypothetical protein
MDESRKDIPTHFNSSWKGINFANSKSIYRSIEWIEMLLYCAPSIISPRFKDQETTIHVNKLIRASLLAIQWEISEENLKEIKT